jgi:hypothetical protein
MNNTRQRHNATQAKFISGRERICCDLGAWWAGVLGGVLGVWWGGGGGGGCLEGLGYLRTHSPCADAMNQNWEGRILAAGELNDLPASLGREILQALHGGKVGHLRLALWNSISGSAFLVW